MLTSSFADPTFHLKGNRYRYRSSGILYTLYPNWEIFVIYLCYTYFSPVLWVRFGFNADPDPVLDPDPGFRDQKVFFFIPWRYVQAHSPQKRTSSTLKHKIPSVFLFCGDFRFPGSGNGSALPMRIRSRIQMTKNQSRSMRIHIHNTSESAT
jgi:hypothetical protein